MLHLKILYPLSILLLSILCIGCTNNYSSQDEAMLCQLPDGSVAVLNQNSEMEFRETDSLRLVILNGEAFFDVVKGELPFEVHTATGYVRVLGTKFRVDGKDDKMDVEVESGVVEVEANQEKRKLRRGERIVYNDAKKSLKKMKAEFKHHIWTDEFKDDMRALGKEIEKGGKEIGKEIKKSWQGFEN